MRLRRRPRPVPVVAPRPVTPVVVLDGPCSDARLAAEARTAAVARRFDWDEDPGYSN